MLGPSEALAGSNESMKTSRGEPWSTNISLLLIQWDPKPCGCWFMIRLCVCVCVFHSLSETQVVQEFLSQQHEIFSQQYQYRSKHIVLRLISRWVPQSSDPHPVYAHVMFFSRSLTLSLSLPAHHRNSNSNSNNNNKNNNKNKTSRPKPRPGAKKNKKK